MATAARPIIMAVDGSEDASKALDYFVANLYRAGDRIIVLTCQEYVPNVAQKSQHIMSEGLVMNAEVWGNIVAKEKNRAEKVTKEFSAKINDMKLNAEFRCLHGKPGEVIVGEAKKENAKLIVIGARGIGRIRKALLGSVSDYVIQHATCPVTVYRVDLKV